MGCGPSKHDDTEQAVDLVLFCRERKRFIKKAVTYRSEFAIAHAAYIHTLRNVGTTLTRLMEGEDTALISDSFRFSSSPGTTSSMFTTEVGSTSQAQKSVSPTPSPPAETHVVFSTETAAASMAMETHNEIQTQKQQKEEEEEENSSSESESEENHVVSHLRSMTTQSTLFYQERPSSPETYTMSSYSAQNFGSGGGFLSSYFEPVPPRHGSQFGFQSAEDAAVPPPPSPPPSNSTWDFFDPFSSLENMYGYQTRRLSQVFDEEEFKDLKRLREEEGIPELEDVSESSKKQQEKKAEDVANPAKENIIPPAPQEPPKEAVADKEQSQKQAIPENEQSQKEAVPDKEQAKEEASTSAVKGETETFGEESKVDALTQTPSEPKVVESTSEAAQVITKEEALNVLQKSEERSADPNQPIQQEATSKRSNMFQTIKDIEYQFLRAYEAGFDVSGLLEVSKIPRSSSFRGLRDQSARVLSSIMRSSSSRASSFRSQFAVVDNMDDSSSDIGEECGMLSGCHSSTLDRLVAWEKKLYQEVKAGDGVRMEYEKKCALLRMQESKGYDHYLIDDTRSTVKHLHTQITVNIQQTEKFFTNIRSLANRQLQPQLKELIMGLKKMWSIMLECHQMQHQFILESKHLNDAAAYWICVESNPKLTIQLERDLWMLHDSFTRLFDSQKAYVQALTGWLSRCVNIDTESSAKGSKATLSPHRTIAPDVFHICRDWCQALAQIQEKAVVNAIKSFAQDLHELWAKQEEEKRQKKRVDHYEKGLVKKIGGLQKVESKRHERLSSFQQPETVDPVIEHRKMSVESFRKVVDDEKEKHQKISTANRSTVMNVLQKGLAFTFETLIKFSEESSKKYEHILENYHSRT